LAANKHAGLLDDAPPGPWRDFADGYRMLLSGKFVEAHELFQGAYDVVRSGGPREVGAPADLEARTATQLALLSLVDLRYHDMVAYGEAAVRAGTTNRAVAAFARFARALGLALAGRAHEALADLADVDLPGAPSGLDGLAARGMLRLWTDDLSGAEQDLRAAVTRATQGESLRIAQALGYLGELRYRRGALGDAVQYCELAIGDAETNGRVWDLALTHGLACVPTAARGDWAAADRHASESANWAELVGTRTGRVYAAVGRGAIAQARGDARRTLAAADDMLKYYETREPGTHLFGPLRADALAQLGRADDAEVFLADYAKVALDLNRTSGLMGVARVRGRIAAARGMYAEAVEQVEHARELAEKVGLPIEAARADMLAAEWLHALRRYSDAAAHLDAALARLNLAGAGAYVAQAQTLNERLRLPVGDRLAALRDLTDREHAVALQVGAGRTRRQVATDLVISVKTVDNHLAKIFSKLDVRSQGELRQLLDRAR
jgi:DNA-binding NarL/FixJ family response regulator